MKRVCIGVLVGAGVLGLGWLGGVNYIEDRNVGTMAIAMIAVWAGIAAWLSDPL
jgi:hypothetical protein